MGWGIGFSSAKASESESELSEPCSAVYFIKGYESAVTAVVTDSEDDLFFLDGKFCFELNAFFYSQLCSAIPL